MERIKQDRDSLALITQDRGFEKILGRVARNLGKKVDISRDCEEFIRRHAGSQRGVLVYDASVCDEFHLGDFQMLVSRVPSWEFIYLPRTNKKQEIKEVMGLGAFGCLHKPVSEREVRQMLESALGI